VVSRAYPGPIGRLRVGNRGMKREEGGVMSGRVTPLRSGTPSSLAQRLRAAAAVDLTGNGDGSDVPFPPFAAKTEGDGSEFGESPFGDEGDDPLAEGDGDFALPSWVAMLSELGVTPPSETEVLLEQSAGYEGAMSRSMIHAPQSVLAAQAPAWQYNSHFLLSPSVVLRERIPGPLFVLVQTSFVLGGSGGGGGPYAMLRVKDPFGSMEATVHAACLRTWGPALLRPHTALHLRDVVLFHAAAVAPSLSSSGSRASGTDSSNGARMLILGPGSIAGLWDAREYEEREKQMAAEMAAAVAEAEAMEEQHAQPGHFSQARVGGMPPVAAV